MDINVRLKEEKDYRRVEEITRAAFGYPAFMAMELKEGYLKDFRGGKYFESDIYDDEFNREIVRAFDKEFMLDK